ncbi:unnamed protein product [Rotaria sp. Silwood2]|nr:unnamed protein product [Rotaria sp. Silwood2]CAF2710343.1 unnamed protein product [Rotaria sp. Silwood2]
MASSTAFPDSNGYTKSFSFEETSELLKFFEEYGFVVVRNIIESKSQIEETIDEIWSLLGVLNPKIDKNDSSTWDNKYWPIQLGLKDGGFISHMSDVAIKMCWENRQHPNIVRLFQIILKQDDLWVRYDRYGMMRPTKGIAFKQNDNDGSVIFEDKSEWRSKPNWLHWDQNPWRYPDFIGVQGLLALSDTNPNTGGFHCVPGFTHRFKQWSIDNEKEHKCRGGLVNVPEGDPIRNEIKQIHVQKGSFIVWDSRLPHGNFPNESDQFRIVQYITFQPAKEDDKRELTSRIDAFHMRTLSSKVDEQLDGFPEPQLTELGEKIVGLRSTLNCIISPSTSCDGYNALNIYEYCTDFRTFLDSSSGLISTVDNIIIGSKFCVAFQSNSWIGLRTVKCVTSGDAGASNTTTISTTTVASCYNSAAI